VNWKSTLPNNLVPTITDFSPKSWVTDIFDTYIELYGTKFSFNSVVLVNGAPALTYVFSSTDLIFDLPPSDLTTTGTLQLSVFNGSPGGGPSQPVAFPVKPADFSLSVANSLVSVRAGQSVSTTVFAYPNPAFHDGVSLSCSGLPANLSCSFDPGRILIDNFAVVTFTAKSLSSSSLSLSASLALCFPVVGILWMRIMKSSPRNSRRRVMTLVGLMLIGLMLGCGSGGSQSPSSSRTPSPSGGGSTGTTGGSGGGSTTGSGTGTYSVTITGTSGSIQHTVTINVNVTS